MTIKQDIIIWRIVPYSDDEILKDKDVYYDEDSSEIYSAHRECVVYELNRLGYRIVQFLHDDNSVICGEAILVEKIE